MERLTTLQSYTTRIIKGDPSHVRTKIYIELHNKVIHCEKLKGILHLERQYYIVVRSEFVIGVLHIEKYITKSHKVTFTGKNCITTL